MKQHSTGQSTEEWVNKLKCKEEETGQERTESEEVKNKRRMDGQIEGRWMKVYIRTGII